MCIPITCRCHPYAPQHGKAAHDITAWQVMGGSARLAKLALQWSLVVLFHCSIILSFRILVGGTHSISHTPLCQTSLFQYTSYLGLQLGSQSRSIKKMSITT